MPDMFLLQQNARAMQAYTLGMLSTDPHTHRAEAWSRKMAREIESEREAIRVAESGGGMCHLVSEWLWDKYGWTRFPVSYLDRKGDVICAGHLINILPDGAILDATADQFGEGFSVRRLTSRNRDYGRYRPEFDDDFNPDRYDCASQFYWNGVPDFAAQDQIRGKFGLGWWLEDVSHYVSYLQHQVTLGGNCYRPWLEALEHRHACSI
jgi:hypothetical protein